MTKKCSFVERINELIRIKHLRQSDLARDTGINKGLISRYVNGKTKPREEFLCKISSAYNVDLNWLCGFDVPMEKKQDTSVLLYKTIVNKIGSLSMKDLEKLSDIIDILFVKNYV